MAIAVTLEGTGQSKSTDVDVAATFNAGDAVIVVWAADSASEHGAQLLESDDTVVRSKSDVQHDVVVANSGNVITKVYSFLNLTAGEVALIAKVRVQNAIMGDSLAVAVYSASGLETSSAVDKTATGTGTGTAASAGPTATLFQADELVIGVVGVKDEIDDQTGVWTTGAAQVDGNEQKTGTNGGGDASNISVYAAAEVVAATTAMNADVTGMDNVDWAAVIATFKGVVDLGAQPYYHRTGGVPGMRIGRPGIFAGRTW